MATFLIDHCDAVSNRSVSGTRLARRNLRLQGFSIIELMVVIAIVGVVMAIAIPSFSIMLRKNRLSSAAAAMQVSLSLARSEAIKHGIDAYVTVAANGTAGAWADGWTVFLDKTGTANNSISPATSTVCSATVTTCPIEAVAALSGPVSFGQTATENYFMYNGQGRMVTTTNAAANRSFYFYDGSSDRYCLVVSVGGRVRTAIVASGTSCPTS